MAKKRKRGPKKAKPIAAQPRMVDDQPLQPSAKLAAVIGNQKIRFIAANRKVWRVIQLRGFRSRDNPRMIEIKEKVPHTPLTNLFGKTLLSMYEMSRILRRELT